jgi:hypothetical protein
MRPGVEPGLAPEEHCPLTHQLQTAAPMPDWRPEGQVSHSTDPRTGANVLIGQLWHASASVRFVNFPSGHERQPGPVRSVLYVPGKHSPCVGVPLGADELGGNVGALELGRVVGGEVCAKLGNGEGTVEGLWVGDAVGEGVGRGVGETEGAEDVGGGVKGESVGSPGATVGCGEGCGEGFGVGLGVGEGVGRVEGEGEGLAVVGDIVGSPGDTVGPGVGRGVGGGVVGTSVGGAVSEIPKSWLSEALPQESVSVFEQLPSSALDDVSAVTWSQTSGSPW